MPTNLRSWLIKSYFPGFFLVLNFLARILSSIVYDTDHYSIVVDNLDWVLSAVNMSAIALIYLSVFINVTKAPLRINFLIKFIYIWFIIKINIFWLIVLFVDLVLLVLLTCVGWCVRALSSFAVWQDEDIIKNNSSIKENGSSSSHKSSGWVVIFHLVRTSDSTYTAY